VLSFCVQCTALDLLSGRLSQLKGALEMNAARIADIMGSQVKIIVCTVQYGPLLQRSGLSETSCLMRFCTEVSEVSRISSRSH
jgi:hypothetical protein